MENDNLEIEMRQAIRKAMSTNDHWDICRVQSLLDLKVRRQIANHHEWVKKQVDEKVNRHG